jgi:hypothetical protein
MKPITIFSLGGTAPFAPSTDDGTMYGKLAIANALPHKLFKNCRRFTPPIGWAGFMLSDFIKGIPKIAGCCLSRLD